MNTSGPGALGVLRVKAEPGAVQGECQSGVGVGGDPDSSRGQRQQGAAGSPGRGQRGLCGCTCDSMVMTPSRSRPQPSWLWARTRNTYEWLGRRSSTTTEVWPGLGMWSRCSSPRRWSEQGAGRRYSFPPRPGPHLTLSPGLPGTGSRVLCWVVD